MPEHLFVAAGYFLGVFCGLTSAMLMAMCRRNIDENAWHLLLETLERQFRSEFPQIADTALYLRRDKDQVGIAQWKVEIRRKYARNYTE